MIDHTNLLRLHGPLHATMPISIALDQECAFRQPLLRLQAACDPCETSMTVLSDQKHNAVMQSSQRVQSKVTTGLRETMVDMYFNVRVHKPPVESKALVIK